MRTVKCLDAVATRCHAAIPVTGRVYIRRNGVLVQAGHNVVTTAGLILFASLIAGEAVDPPGYMAMGTSGAPSNVAMTELVGTELDRQAVIANRTANSISYAATLGDGIGDLVTVREFGIFNAAVDGTMLCRFIAQPLLMDVGETLDVIWTISIGGA